MNKLFMAKARSLGQFYRLKANVLAPTSATANSWEASLNSLAVLPVGLVIRLLERGKAAGLDELSTAVFILPGVINDHNYHVRFGTKTVFRYHAD